MELLSLESLFYLGLAICLTFTAYVNLDHRQRDIILARLKVKRRRRSSAQTPPRSVSPEKKPENSAMTEPDYSDIFPPSQRHVLQELIPSFSTAQRETLGDLEPDPDSFAKSLVGWEEDYALADPSKFVFSGFSVKEIQALGDFPDYARLSGVPLPEPYENFNLETALSRPYRPFRWAYHQTMSLTRMENDWWLELDSDYRDRIAQRMELYEQHGEGVLQCLPGSELATKELMENALLFLSARYPQYFTLSALPSDPSKTVFENKILGTTQIVQDKPPLLMLLENVPEDFAIMLRNPETGQYHFRSGMICSSLGWNVASKMSKSLSEIHGPVVPDYREKMQFSMDRYFSKMPCDRPIQRGSWGLEVDKPLYMPPGDPHEKYRDSQDPSVTLDRVNLRIDWQTLRRLPLSGAIVFNFKALFTPITEFRTEPYIPSIVAKVCREGKENIMAYKNAWHVLHVALPALDNYAKEQENNGMIEKDWDVHTLEESPFFPGWEEKWHSQQGF